MKNGLPLKEAGAKDGIERKSFAHKKLSSWEWAKRITAYAIPVCLGAIVVPLLTLVDTFTMPRLLEAAQGSEREAMRQFGLYNRGLPLRSARCHDRFLYVSRA